MLKWKINLLGFKNIILPRSILVSLFIIYLFFLDLVFFCRWIFSMKFCLKFIFKIRKHFSTFPIWRILLKKPSECFKIYLKLKGWRGSWFTCVFDFVQKNTLSWSCLNICLSLHEPSHNLYWIHSFTILADKCRGQTPTTVPGKPWEQLQLVLGLRVAIQQVFKVVIRKCQRG